MARRKNPQEGANQPETAKKTMDYDELCNQIVEKLKVDGKAKKSDFPEADKSQFSYAQRAIKAALHAADWDVSVTSSDREVELCLTKTGDSYLRRYDTDLFRTNHQTLEKRKIGQLVSLYLAALPRRVLLGSGSTVHWVGRALAEFPPQIADRMAEVLTVNIALASYWCEFKAPFDAISVLAGYLDTKRFRYRRMSPPAFPMPIVVFGADGCYYDEESDEGASLFGVYSDVSSNTGDFIANARDTVICCLTHDKLEHTDRQNCGEEFEKPQPFVQKILVTDKEPESKLKKNALEKAGWKTITCLSDWKQLDEGKAIQEIVDSLKEAGIGWDWEELG